MTISVSAQVRESNVSHYGDGTEIDTYLEEPHHKLRITFALQRLAEALPPSRKVTGLELASATGNTASLIASMGYSVVASDASSEVVAKAAASGLPSICFDAAGVFPFTDSSFDFIFSGELIEHIFDVRRFLAECRRVLKANGLLVLTTPNLATINDRASFIFGKSPRHVNALHPYLYLHIRPFTKSSLLLALSECGFGKTTILSHFLEIGPEIFRFRSKTLAKWFPSLGKSLIALSWNSKHLVP